MSSRTTWLFVAAVADRVTCDVSREMGARPAPLRDFAAPVARLTRACGGGAGGWARFRKTYAPASFFVVRVSACGRQPCSNTAPLPLVHPAGGDTAHFCACSDSIRRAFRCSPESWSGSASSTRSSKSASTSPQRKPGAGRDGLRQIDTGPRCCCAWSINRQRHQYRIRRAAKSLQFCLPDFAPCGSRDPIVFQDRSIARPANSVVLSRGRREPLYVARHGPMAPAASDG